MTPDAPFVCKGSAEQIGRCQGDHLRDRVLRSQTLLDELEAFRIAKPRGLPFPIFRWLARRDAASVWRRTLAAQAPDMADRIRGIAEASGARLAELQLLNLIEPILSDLRKIAKAAPLSGCSAVAVRGSRSAGGRPVIARNFDYLPLAQPFYALREVRPATGYRSLEFTVAPLAGAVDGINEKGLAITNNYAYATDEPPQPSPTLTMAISQALASCATVEEAEEFFREARLWGGGILMLADATGDVLSLEISNTKRASHRPADDSLFHTNSFRSGAMRDVEVARGDHYGALAPRVLRGRRIHESGERRESRLRELLAGDQPLDLEDLERIMSHHGSGATRHESGDAPSLNSVCMHSDYWFTTATLQFLPVERRIRASFSTACEAKFVEYGL